MKLEQLQAVKTIVCHQNSPGSPCPDGVASAIVLRDVLPLAEVVFCDHDQIRRLAPKEHMLFCDITPNPDQIPAFQEVGSLVLDHHEANRVATQAFGENGYYRSGYGYSGAYHAFTQVWMKLRSTVPGATEMQLMHDFAGMAAIRDSWHKSHPWWGKACEQAEALRFWPWEKWPVHPFETDHHKAVFQQLLDVGGVLYEKRMAGARRTAEEAWMHTTTRGTRVAIIPTVETSDAADLIEADVVVGFQYRLGAEGLKLVLSMRARGVYDVGSFCKGLGVGGHRAAAGVTIRADAVEAFAAAFAAHAPYMLIPRLFVGYEF